jgi:hypothetical protein
MIVYLELYATAIAATAFMARVDLFGLPVAGADGDRSGAGAGETKHYAGV